MSPYGGEISSHTNEFLSFSSDCETVVPSSLLILLVLWISCREMRHRDEDEAVEEVDVELKRSYDSNGLVYRPTLSVVYSQFIFKLKYYWLTLI